MLKKQILVGSAFAAALALTACSESPEQALANRWPLLEQYCTECHNDAEAAGNMSLEGVTPAEVAANPEKWENVVRRLRGAVLESSRSTSSSRPSRPISTRRLQRAAPRPGA
jgi:hypothetical protein